MAHSRLSLSIAEHMLSGRAHGVCVYDAHLLVHGPLSCQLAGAGKYRAAEASLRCQLSARQQAQPSCPVPLASCQQGACFAQCCCWLLQGCLLSCLMMWTRGDEQTLDLC